MQGLGKNNCSISHEPMSSCTNGFIGRSRTQSEFLQFLLWVECTRVHTIFGKALITNTGAWN